MSICDVLGNFLDAGEMTANKQVSFTARSLYPQWIYRQINKILVECLSVLKLSGVRIWRRRGPNSFSVFRKEHFSRNLNQVRMAALRISVGGIFTEMGICLECLRNNKEGSMAGGQ